ncbi:MAG TPA: hypothetical protein VFI39_07460 [Gemmatimonadales bacterium]|nr:hypothetical protein [Gemmatimonadales bacterium]
MLRLPVLAAALLTAAVPLAAQTPDQGSVLASADSGHDAGTATLSSYGKRTAAALIQLAGEQVPVSTLHRAVRQFELALRERRDDPWAWYGLARANLQLHESGTGWVSSETRVFGMSYYEAFLADLRQSLAVNDAFAPALRLLAASVASEPERLQPPWVMQTLDAPGSAQAAGAMAWLVRGRFERAAHHFAKADTDFAAYRAAGGDPGLTLLEVARSEAADDSLDAAAAAYLAGLDSAGPAGRRAYRLDLEWIADSGELAAFDATPAPKLSEWVTRFYEKRDAADVRDSGERLKEQLRRWVYVHQHFALTHPTASARWGAGWFRDFQRCLGSDSTTLVQFGTAEPLDTLDPRHAERVLDDRAIIYMRHGAPSRDLYSGGGTLETIDRQSGKFAPEDRDAGVQSGGSSVGELLDPGDADEVWLYSMEGAPRSYQFVGSAQLGLQAPTTLLWFPEDPWLLEERGLVDPDFTRLAMISVTPEAAPAGLFCLPSAQRMETRSRVDLAVAATTDGYPPLFPTAVTPLVQVNAIADSGGGAGHLVLAYAAPAGQLVPVLRDDRLVYPLRYRLVAVDTAGNVVRQSGDASVLSPDTLGDGHYLSGVLDLKVPAGLWRLGFVLEQPGGVRGGAISAPGLRIGLDHPLDVSTLFLGTDRDEVTWSAGSRTIPLTPESAYPRGSRLDLFYQVSGLTAGDGFRTSIAIYRHDNDRLGSQVVQIGFRGEATGPDTPRQLGVDISRLRAGSYLLVVTVSRADGSAPVRRERPFSIYTR